MKQRLTLLCAVLLLFTSSAIFAQEKSANFLGTWKLAGSGNKSKDVKLVTMTVTETGNDLIIERNTQKAASAETYSYKTTFKTTGSTITKLIGGNLGGVEMRSLRFLNDNKMQLLTTVRRDSDLETILASTPFRETWTVSEDGKTLTVKTVAKYASGKVVFVKE